MPRDGSTITPDPWGLALLLRSSGNRNQAGDAGTRLKRQIIRSVFPWLAEGFLSQRDDRLDGECGPPERVLAEVYEATRDLLFRLLFLFFAESRDLWADPSSAPGCDHLTAIRREIKHAAGDRLDEADSKIAQVYSPRETCLYDRLRVLFDRMPNVLARGDGRVLHDSNVPDVVLARAIDRLSREDSGPSIGLQFIDYRSMDVRTLGAIYEGLLNCTLRVASEDLMRRSDESGERYVPVTQAKAGRRKPNEVVVRKGRVYLSTVKFERKASGSYYTPATITRYIVAQAVGPVLAEKLERLRAEFQRFRDTFEQEFGLAEEFERVTVECHTTGQIGALFPNPLREMETYNSPPWEGGVGGMGSKLPHSAAPIAPRPLSKGEQFEAELYSSDGQCPPPLPPLPKGGSYEVLRVPKGEVTGDTAHNPNALRCELTPAEVAEGRGSRSALSTGLGALTSASHRALLHAQNQHPGLAEKLFDMRVLDPAVGCGYFLVEALSFLSERMLAFLNEFPINPVSIFLDRRRESIVDSLTERGLTIDSTQLTEGRLLKYQLLERCVYGVDRDPMAVELAKATLWLDAAVPHLRLSGLNQHVRIGDSLLGLSVKDLDHPVNEPSEARRALDLRVAEDFGTSDAESFARQTRPFHWDLEFPDVFRDPMGATYPAHTATGFDAVIGNPPYVRMELIKPLKPFLRKHYRCHAERSDLFIYFYERSIRLLRAGGRLALIAPSTWTKTKAGEGLREFLKAETALHSFIDFGDLPLFEHATTYACILVASRQVPPADQVLESTIVGENDVTNRNRGAKSAPVFVRQADLESTGWTFAGCVAARLRDKVQQRGVPLASYCGFDPLRGIVSGLNQAFVVDTATRDRIVDQDPNCAEILRPYLEGKDLLAWRAKWRGLWLIHADRGIAIDRYPAIRAHLERYRERLERRATSRQHAWYELQQPQRAYASSLRGPKLLYPDITIRPRFVFDELGHLCGNTTYFLPDADRYLQGLLHSDVLWWYLRGSVRLIRGGYLRLFSQYVGALPIVQASPADVAIIGGLAERLSMEPDTDGDCLKAELNSRVAALYGLTAEEAKLVSRNEI